MGRDAVLGVVADEQSGALWRGLTALLRVGQVERAVAVRQPGLLLGVVADDQTVALWRGLTALPRAEQVERVAAVRRAGLVGGGQ